MTQSPTPDEVRAARQAARHTQAEAAAAVHLTPRSWRAWEDTGPSSRHMPGACWELYLLKTGQHPGLQLTAREG